MKNTLKELSNLTNRPPGQLNKDYLTTQTTAITTIKSIVVAGNKNFKTHIMTNGNESETWKSVVGYEGLYEVSDNGCVRSNDRLIKYPNGRTELRPGKMMVVIVNSRNGYCYVGLTKNRKQKGKRVHRLVAQSHIPNPDNLPEVNHEDFNKLNNAKTNLKWCDRNYQNQHASKKPGRVWQNHRLGKTGSDNPASKPVIVTNMDGKEIGRYESGSLAAISTNSHQTKVSACCIGKRLHHNNLKFKFA